MGYFSNSTEGMIYEEKYCQDCVHQNGPDGKSGCAVMFAHLMKNYDECNNKDSILHMLIPRRDDGKPGNGRCLMFWPKARPGGGEPEPVVEMTDADKKYLEWQQGKRFTDGAEREPANKPQRKEVA